MKFRVANINRVGNVTERFNFMKNLAPFLFFLQDHPKQSGLFQTAKGDRNLHVRFCLKDVLKS